MTRYLSTVSKQNLQVPIHTRSMSDMPGVLTISEINIQGFPCPSKRTSFYTKLVQLFFMVSNHLPQLRMNLLLT